MTKQIETQEWSRPQLIRLGSMRDVAGPNGNAQQSPIQTRS